MLIPRITSSRPGSGALPRLVAMIVVLPLLEGPCLSFNLTRIVRTSSSMLVARFTKLFFGSGKSMLLSVFLIGFQSCLSSQSIRLPLRQGTCFCPFYMVEDTTPDSGSPRTPRIPAPLSMPNNTVGVLCPMPQCISSTLQLVVRLDFLAGLRSWKKTSGWIGKAGRGGNPSPVSPPMGVE